MRLLLSPYPLMTTSVKATRVTSDWLIASYATVPHNRPGANQNFVQVWQDAEPEYENPTGGWTASVTGTSTQGDLPVGFLYQKKDYVLCYSVGPHVENIVATALIPGGDLTRQQFFSTTLSAVPGLDTLLVSYVSPDSCRPNQFRHWLGLFNQDDDPFTGSTLATARIASDARTGSVPVSYSLSSGRSYTVVYFAGPEQTTVACTYTFAVA